MLYFIPWVVLMLAVVVAVPIAAKMSPSPKPSTSPADPDEAELANDDDAVMADDFGGDPSSPAEPLGDDAFAEFN